MFDKEIQNESPSMKKVIIDLMGDIILVEEIKDRSFYLGEHKIKVYKKKELKGERR